MASKLTLLKGRSLQKLLLLVLLTFTGLGYPPKFCEAIKCMSCSGNIEGGTEKCDHRPDLEDCSTYFPDAKDCYTKRYIKQGGNEGSVDKGCEGEPGILTQLGFTCVQGKLSQSGSNCIKAPKSQYLNAVEECRKENPKEPGPPDGEDDKAGAGRQNADTDDDTDFYLCKCFEDFCNEKDVFPSKGPGEPSNETTKGPTGTGSEAPGGNEGGNQGGGKASGASRMNVFPTGLFGLIIMRLATNFIF